MPDTPETFEEYANRAIADRTEELLVLHKRIAAMTEAVRALGHGVTTTRPGDPPRDSSVMVSRAAVLAILEEPKRE